MKLLSIQGQTEIEFRGKATNYRYILAPCDIYGDGAESERTIVVHSKIEGFVGCAKDAQAAVKLAHQHAQRLDHEYCDALDEMYSELDAHVAHQCLCQMIDEQKGDN